MGVKGLKGEGKIATESHDQGTVDYQKSLNSLRNEVLTLLRVKAH